MADGDEPDPTNPSQVIVQPQLPINAAMVIELMRRRQQGLEGLQTQHQTAEQQRAQQVQQMTQLLDQAAQTIRASREGRTNLPLLALGAGMMGSRGNFFEQLGAGTNAMIPAIQSQRSEDAKYEEDLLRLQLNRAKLEAMPAEERLKWLQDQMKAETKGMSDLEKLLVRAGTTPPKEPKDVRTPDEKNRDAWLRENPGKTREDYDRYVAQRDADKEAQKVAAKTEAETRTKTLVELPAAEEAAQDLIKTLRDVRNHAGLPKSVGLGSMAPNIPGELGSGFAAKLEQLRSKARMAGFSGLKGAGAISEAESEFAANAIATLRTNVSKKEFLAQLDSAIEAMESNLRKAYRIAQKPEGQWIDLRTMGEYGRDPFPDDAKPSSTRPDPAKPRRFNPKTGKLED